MPNITSLVFQCLIGRVKILFDNTDKDFTNQFQCLIGRVKMAVNFENEEWRDMFQCLIGRVKMQLGFGKVYMAFLVSMPHRQSKNW